MKRRRNPKNLGKKSKKAARDTRTPTYDDLLSIVDLVRSASQFKEFHLRSGDIEVEFRRTDGAAGPLPPAEPQSRPADPVGGEVMLEPAGAALRVPHAHPGAEGLPHGTNVVRAPMVGTFYRAPEPGAPPFVEPGSRVAPETIVCIIEVMKLINSIPAGCAGVVTHVLVKDAEPVEYGQPLVAIRSDA